LQVARVYTIIYNKKYNMKWFPKIGGWILVTCGVLNVVTINIPVGMLLIVLGVTLLLEDQIKKIDN